MQMSIMRGLIVVGLIGAAFPRVAAAQTDEIQVYTAEIADKGVFNLTWHNNFTPSGIKTPAFPGAVTADKSWNGVPEWAYGVTKWLEAGLYMPLYSRDDHGQGFGINGFKLRALFVEPDANDKRFAYGVNFEFSVNAARWDPKRYSSEVRPILGWHLNPVDIIINPIVDTEYDGLRNLEFVPSMRVDYNTSPKWAIAAEEYDDFGPVHRFDPLARQVHETWAVVDYTGALSVEAGVGVGLTGASDHLTLKLILSKDLNKKKVR